MFSKPLDTPETVYHQYLCDLESPEPVMSKKRRKPNTFSNENLLQTLNSSVAKVKKTKIPILPGKELPLKRRLTFAPKMGDHLKREDE